MRRCAEAVGRGGGVTALVGSQKAQIPSKIVFLRAIVTIRSIKLTRNSHTFTLATADHQHLPTIVVLHYATA